ncbi:hypothetical protein [Dehalobacter sp. 4CP]|uniref:hypothetical protein n=1 Tax=Dehalobacter sp. CP TaxID=2594474 RepID=UPI0039ED3756|nr:hypothetical protein [Dehalobacter sp.]
MAGNGPDQTEKSNRNAYIDGSCQRHGADACAICHSAPMPRPLCPERSILSFYFTKSNSYQKFGTVGSFVTPFNDKVNQARRGDLMLEIDKLVSELAYMNIPKERLISRIEEIYFKKEGKKID